MLCRRRYNLAAPGGLVAPSPAGRGGLDGVEGAGRLRLCIRSVSHPGAGLGVSGQYVRRDETCPVSTGGTRRFQLVQGEGGRGGHVSAERRLVCVDSRHRKISRKDVLQQQQPRGRARRLTAVAGRYVLPGAEEEEGAAAEAFAGWPVMRLDEPAVQKAAPTGGAQEGQQPGGDSARKMGSAEPPEDEQRAALKIQARHRGAKTREKLKQEKEEREEFHGAALKIQARHRGAKTREKLKLEKEEREEFHGAALKIQARHRGAKTREKLKLEKEEREEFHGAALKIQARHRGAKTREKLAREARARLAQEDGAVARLQGWFRRTVTRLRVEATRNELLAEQLRATCRIQSWWYPRAAAPPHRGDAARAGGRAGGGHQRAQDPGARAAGQGARGATRPEQGGAVGAWRLGQAGAGAVGRGAGARSRDSLRFGLRSGLGGGLWGGWAAAAWCGGGVGARHARVASGCVGPGRGGRGGRRRRQARRRSSAAAYGLLDLRTKIHDQGSADQGGARSP